jgi:5'-deoxynucleotidase
MINHFFAYISKMRWIYRWGMKRNAIQENVMEHSFEVAAIAHNLAVVSKHVYGNDVDPNQVLAAALYHDASEALTGDLPSPIKYHNQKIRDAYKEVERTAEQEMLAMLPEELRPVYREILLEENLPKPVKQLVKAGDLIASLIKCKAEVNAGNKEFEKAVDDVEQRLDKMAMPEVQYFMDHFMPSFDLTLDELITHSETLFHDVQQPKG